MNKNFYAKESNIIICNASGCFKTATERIDIDVGKFGIIPLDVCSNCIHIFREGKKENVKKNKKVFHKYKKALEETPLINSKIKETKAIKQDTKPGDFTSIELIENQRLYTESDCDNSIVIKEKTGNRIIQQKFSEYTGELSQFTVKDCKSRREQNTDLGVM